MGNELSGKIIAILAEIKISIVIIKLILDLPNCECDASGRKPTVKVTSSYVGHWCTPKETPCKMLNGEITGKYKNGDDWDWIQCDVQVHCNDNPGNKCTNTILKSSIKSS